VQSEPHDQDVAPPLEKNFEGADFINERTQLFKGNQLIQEENPFEAAAAITTSEDNVFKKLNFGESSQVKTTTY
tara:strand:- start:334 stop:555 length:222 start_codon:yes stop_codon:yes gene_type:complete